MSDLLLRLSSAEGAERLELLVALRSEAAQLTNEQVRAEFSPAVLENLLNFSSNSSNTLAADIVDNTRDLLDKCLPLVSDGAIFQTYQTALLVGLQKAHPRLRVALLLHLARVAELHPNCLSGLTGAGSALIVAAVRLFDSENMTISQASQKFLVAIAQNPSGMQVLFGCSGFVSELNELYAKGTVVRFRVHEFAVALCKLSNDALRCCVHHQMTTKLFDELTCDDILTQLNCLELLGDLAAGPSHCLQFLHEQGWLAQLHALLISSQEAPDGGFLFPAIIRFFGLLSRLYPRECVQLYPRFVACMFDLIFNWQSLDISMRLLAFDSISLFGSTSEGKLALSEKGDAMNTVMKAFGKAIMQGATEVRARHLEALHDLLHLESMQDNNLLNITRQWFMQLDANPMDMLYHMFKQPIIEVRCGVGRLLSAIANQPWGQKVIAQQPGLLEYLLNRDSEFQMEGRYVKYEIIECLAKSTSSADAFLPEDLVKIKTYYREGAFFIKGHAQVALEEG